MKIHWFSPLPPAHTDIANYTARLAPYLAQRADVIFCHDRDARPANFPFATRAIQDLSTTEINQADLNVYHIGNNADFHASIWSTAQRHPGLVVLHDFAVHQFVHESLNVHGNRPIPRRSEDYIRLMRDHYGEEGYRVALEINAGRLPPAAASAEFPLCEAVVCGNLAVLTHNQGVVADLAQRLPLVPVFDLPLPFPVPTSPADARRDLSRHALRVVSFGFTGPNRRLLEFLDAWASCTVRDHIQLDICGELWNPDLVKERLAQLGLTQQARLHGFVSDQVLNKLLDKAHLVLNLRYPTMGEASGSQLRIWSRAAAAVVTDVGWYASLPDDGVFKIRPDHEAQDLRALLERLAADPTLATAVGAAGAQHLAAHAPQDYAERLIDMCRNSLKDWHLQWLALEMARRAGATMGDFLLGQATMPRAVSDMFDPA